MFDIQQSALGPFEKDLLALVDGLVHQNGGIADIPSQGLAPAQESLDQHIVGAFAGVSHHLQELLLHSEHGGDDRRLVG